MTELGILILLIISLLCLLGVLLILQSLPSREVTRRITPSRNGLPNLPRWWLLFPLIIYLCLSSGPILAQAENNIVLRIRLRQGDGSPIFNERVTLERLPEETAIRPVSGQREGDHCLTDSRGECSWLVKRGLYQLLFSRPLDTVSALALAEGGLRGFGLTVGDEAITYHFTFHSNGHIYYDDSPNAALPSPYIPALEPEGALQDGSAALTTTPAGSLTTTTTTVGTLTPAAVTIAAVLPPEAPKPAGRRWRFLLMIGAGLASGALVYGLQRRSAAATSPDLSRPEASSQESQHA